jgi:hypothetical protein
LRVRFQQDLLAHQGKLLSGGRRGVAVHAGSFIRKGEIVLDSALLASPREATRILTHELYHFVWPRLGNRLRRSFEKLLEEEIRAGVRGELGWSAQWRKEALTASGPRARSRQWLEYACESFCDTAAWMASGSARHQEFTLPLVCRRKRREWFRHARELGCISL